MAYEAVIEVSHEPSRVEVLNAAAAVEATTERIAAAQAARQAAEIQFRSEQ